MAVNILVGDCRQTLRNLPDQSVHCVITSPPYWGLRSYKGDPGMIGMEPTFDEHVANLLEVFDECWRVMRDDATLWLNYGDAYWGGKGASSSTAEGFERRTSSTLNKDYHHVNKFGGTRPLDRRDQGFKPKDLVMMPARIAIAMQERGCADLKAVQTLDSVISAICDEYDGQPIPDKIDNVLDRLYAEYHEAKGKSWYLRSEIVWAKRNCMPESVKDRPTSSHEKIFLFAKQPKYFYDSVAVRNQSKDPDDDLRRMTYKTDNNPEDRKRYPDKEVNGIRNRSGSDYTTGTSNLRNVWHLATESFKGAHFATFPTRLVEPCIKAGTSEHGVCGATGAPYVRETTKTLVPTPKAAKRSIVDERDHAADKNSAGSNRQKDGHVPGYRNEYETTGWKPTCHPKKKRTGKDLTGPRQDGNPWNENESGGFLNTVYSTTGWKPTCGAPYKRIVDVKGRRGKSWHDHSDDLGHGRSESVSLPSDYTIETKGWQPTCECNGDRRPSVVLDPFGGSGTVSVVAERLGRDSVICEISAEYAEIARQRISAEHLPMFPSEITITSMETDDG